MPPDICQKKGCGGAIEDGYCSVCGLAAARLNGASSSAKTASVGISMPATGPSSPFSSSASSPVARSSRRRSTRTSSRSTRRQLGAGLVMVPELPSTEPELAILAEPKVPEHKRFCAACENPLSRERGFCGKCGKKYSFVPSLKPADVVADQYLVKGAIAYGGLGWIYLGFDQRLSRYVVLKGLLNTEDESSAAVAVAERQFLAAVKHSNIVGIYNFVKHGTEGFIVMEYVGGKTLREIRKSRGPLPVSEAIAYIHRILSAFAYLHQMGMVYCDFKPDNIMLEGDDVKLIDMGGVRRIDDTGGDVYGTVGYSAPEAGEGPTVVSDLYTVGRTLAVLLTDIKGFGREHRYSLPTREEDGILGRHESLYRFLLRSTHQNPDERFQSADEMADQLLGVLREIVALETGTPRPASSTVFGSDMLSVAGGHIEPIQPDYHQLPLPAIDATDPGFNAVLNASAIPDPGRRVSSLRQAAAQFPKSSEALLRLAGALTDYKDYAAASETLAEVERRDEWDWRTSWLRGRSLLAQSKPQEALPWFDRVFSELPGELAPKLAMGLAAEQLKDYDLAIRCYEIVSRTDPGFVSAAFGLARCRCAGGDRAAACEALGRIPASSSLYVHAQVESARALIQIGRSAPGVDEFRRASAAIEALSLEGFERYWLSRQVLETALGLITSRTLAPQPSITVLGLQLEENAIRLGLENSLRSMARLAQDDEKIRLIDEANRVRPRTLF